MASSDVSFRRSLSISSVAVYALLVFLTFAAAAVRLPPVGESLWLDELHTAWVVADGVDPIAPRAKSGNQAPLYFYLVWATTRFLGLNELALRLPSLVAGVALAPLAFVIVRRWTHSLAAALTAAVIAAADRDFLFYAGEARVYALIQLLALLRVLAFVELLASPKAGWRVAYVALAAAMFYLHYTTVLLWIGEAVCVIGVGLSPFAERKGAAFAERKATLCALSWSERRLSYGRRFLLDTAAIVLLCLPAAPHMKEVMERRENWMQFIARPTPDRFASDRFLARVTPPASYLLPQLVCLALAVVARSVLRRRNPREESNAARRDSASSNQAFSPTAPMPSNTSWRLLLVVAVWIATPVAAAWLASMTDVFRLFLYRYLIASAAGVPLLAGLLCGLGPTPRWRLVAAGATCLAALAVASPPSLSPLPLRNEDWRSAVEFINRGDDRFPVLLYAGLIECETYAASPDRVLQDFCLLPLSGVYRMESEQRGVFPWCSPSREPPPEARQAILSAGGAWVVLRMHPPAARETLEKLALGLAGDVRFDIMQTQAFGNVTVARVEKRSDRVREQ